MNDAEDHEECEHSQEPNTERFMLIDALGVGLQVVANVFGAVANGIGTISADLYHEADRRRALINEEDARSKAGFEIERLVNGDG